MNYLKTSIAVVLVSTALSGVALADSANIKTPTQTSAATSVNQSSEAEAARKFVQAFYTWYRTGKPEPTEETVLQKKRDMLSKPLYVALKEDADASAKVKDEIVGLDFDPFLNAQDVAEKYVVGGVKKKGNTYWVDVYGIWQGKKSAKPDATPELALQNGKWVFVNFHYGQSDIPVNENLLSILKQLKKDREKHPS